VPVVTAAVMAVTLAGTTSENVTEAAAEGPLFSVVSVHWMPAPAVTGEVFSTFDEARSAEVVTVPGVVGLVHAPTMEVLQAVSEVTVAVLLTDVPDVVVDSTVPPIVTVAVAAFASVPKVHETTWPVTVHVPVGLVAVIPVIEAGTVSTMFTFAASDGPWLLVLTVHWIADPATTGDVFNTLVLTSPAEVVTVPATVGLVHAPAIAVLHGVSEVTVAVFATDAPEAVDERTVPPIETDAAAPFATVANVHETAWPVMVQVPEAGVGVAVILETFEGTESLITTFAAADGPLFVDVTVQLIGAPATTGDVFKTFVLTSPADPVAVPDAVHAAAPGQLFVETASAVALVTLNELEIVEPAAVVETVPPIVTTADAADASVGKVQLTVCVATEHVPVPLVTVAVIPATVDGTTSDIETDAAAEGPLLSVVSVHEIGAPATTGEVLSVLVEARSARVTGVTSVQPADALETHEPPGPRAVGVVTALVRSELAVSGLLTLTVICTTTTPPTARFPPI
jgi:hypothetical protein